MYSILRKNSKAKNFLSSIELFISLSLALPLFLFSFPQDILSFFDYSSEKIAFNLKIVSEEKNLKIYELEFPSFVKSAYLENDLVHSFYYKPEVDSKIPAVIIIHGYKARKLRIEKDIARKLAERKIAGIVFVLPYHSSRKPKNLSSRRYFISDDLQRVRETFKQTIIDIRCLINWLEKRKEIDGERIGIMGISLGAIISNLAMGVDERIKVGVSVLGGGNFQDLLWKSILTIPLKIKLISWGINKKMLAQNLGIIDPITFSHRNRPRNVFMINAKLDLIVPLSCAEDLWEALGKPKIKWVWSGHYSVIFMKNRIIKESLDYLEEHLKNEYRK